MIRLVLLRIFESYFRHRWLNLTPIIIMVFAAAGFIAFSKPEYASRGTVYVQKSSLLSSLTKIGDDGFSWNSATQLTMNELSELLQTDAFIRSGISKTSLETRMAGGPDEVSTLTETFRKSVNVQMVGDNLIQISATSSDPALAQQIAQATIEAYTQWKLNGDQQESAVAQSFFAQVIPPYKEELQKARDELKNYLLAHPQPVRGERPPEEQVQIAQYQAAIDSASTRLSSALEKEESARLAQSQAERNVHQNYVVIDAPILPTKPERSFKTIVVNASIFIIIGILLSAISIIGSAILDRSVLFPLDIRNGLEIPVLAIIPDINKLAVPESPSQKASARITEANPVNAAYSSEQLNPLEQSSTS